MPTPFGPVSLGNLVRRVIALEEKVNNMSWNLSDQPHNEGYAALCARLRVECDRYGLPFGPSPVDALEGLLRHIYGNRDLVYAVKDETIKVLKESLIEANELLKADPFSSGL